MFMGMGIDLDIDFDLNSQRRLSFDIEGRRCTILTMHSKETMASNLNILTCNETKCKCSKHSYTKMHKTSFITTQLKIQTVLIERVFTWDMV